MKNKTILLGLTSLFIFVMISATLLNSSGVVPLPFKVTPEEKGDHGGDHQFPDIKGSIAVAEDKDTGLESLATITQQDAETRALAYTSGGTVVSSSLENENGFLIWKVIVDFNGVNYEISVDAGNGSILWASAGGSETE